MTNGPQDGAPEEPQHTSRLGRPVETVKAPARPRLGDDVHPQLPSEAPYAGDADRLVSRHHDYSQTHWREALIGTVQWHRACVNGAREEIEALDRDIAELTTQRRLWQDQMAAHIGAADALEHAVEQAGQADEERRAKAEAGAGFAEQERLLEDVARRPRGFGRA